ncbi:transcription elongation factor GreA [Candidatus Nomurabacteria bacterium]|nr:transcription elongation factor GreA [Candidatus Nomurabacteria bacterium]
MDQTQYLSQEKLDELKKELYDLKSEGIPRIANRIDEAKQMGDLSENAEYHAAKEEMAWANSRVLELESILENAQVIQKTKSDTVILGSKVVVEVGGNELTFTIVGQQEADPLEGKISNESPIGSALLGAKKGDTIHVQTPAGAREYSIKTVE